MDADGSTDADGSMDADDFTDADGCPDAEGSTDVDGSMDASSSTSSYRNMKPLKYSGQEGILGSPRGAEGRVGPKRMLGAILGRTGG